jgi:NAD(P)-dependent dehydrogenase (short-subunit alcohol dehydrogenase family)
LTGILTLYIINGCFFYYAGAGTIVLVARSNPSSSKLKEVAALEKESGAKIKILQADVSNHEQMSALYTNELANLPSMAGIVLTAMVLHDQLIPQVDSNSFYQVMAPKVAGNHTSNFIKADFV